MRIAVIRNPQSHGNRGRAFVVDPGADLLLVEPESRAAQAAALGDFAARGIDLLVMDGGDGTVRDVLTQVMRLPDWSPLLTVLPSGKTNILAFDLGIRESWTFRAVQAAAARTDRRIRMRAPLQVSREGEAPVIGFFFGAAGLVRAVRLAQDLHRARVVRNTAVGLTLATALAQFSAGGERGAWRQGEELGLALDGEQMQRGPRLVTMATTLHRLPFAMRPFGPARPGLKFLDVDAPPPRLATAVPKLLWGRGDAWLRKHGYRRGDARQVRLSSPTQVILDGEVYPGGELLVTEGPPLRFLTP